MTRHVVRLLLVLAALAGTPAVAAAQSEVVEYYATDALGSIRVVFDATGNVTGRADYRPFGQLFASSGNQKHVYAGTFSDPETDLDFATERMYQARTGRHTRVDPVYAGLFEPQRWNRYAYALNSPLTFVDPEGLLADSGMSGFCGAADSYTRCGGDSLFWGSGGGGGGGFSFGDGYARALDAGYVPGMPSEVWSALEQFNQRAETAFTQAQQTSTTSQATVSTTTEIQLPDGSKVSPKDAPPLVQLVAGVADTTSLVTNPITYLEFFLLSGAGGVAGAICAAQCLAAVEFGQNAAIWIEMRQPGLIEFASDLISTRAPGPYIVAAPGAWFGIGYDVTHEIDQRYFPKK